MAERMISAGGVELCTEPFGDRADRPILLIQGIGASMLWWDEGPLPGAVWRGALRDPLRPPRHRPDARHPRHRGSDVSRRARSGAR
jgi:hypothetical protein